MKTLSFFIVVLVFTGVNEALCQWTTSGNNIYNTNTGNVGIGISTPGYLLHVAKNMTSPSIRIQNLGGSGGAAFEMIDNASGADWKFKATLLGGFKIRDHASGLDVIVIEPNSSANAFYVKTGGKVGIGTATPSVKLDVRGDNVDWGASLQLGNSDLSHMLKFFPGRQSDPNAWIQWKAGDPLRFGTDESGWSEKMRITDDGKVGIGANIPEFKLSLQDDGGILAQGTYGSGTTLSTSGTGTRLIWYPQKAAFRAGYVPDNQWDNDSIGNYSIAMGYNTKAKGNYSTAMGTSTIASGTHSTAMGCETTASANHSLAMGRETTASGLMSTAMGKGTIASGDYSIAMGIGTIASGWASTAIGDNTTASGSEGSIAMGYHTSASGLQSTAMGHYTTASGTYSTAMGENTNASGRISTALGIATEANSCGSLAIGRCNLGGGTAGFWIDTDPLFEIGIGADTNNPANAMTVLKNGKVGIGNYSPGYLLTMESSGGGYYNESTNTWVNGCSRVSKQDILPNDLDVLRVLRNLNVVKYRFKEEVENDPDAAFHIGFIAEDAPELLSGKNHDGMYTSDCIGLLLAITKEQQVMIENQQKQIEMLIQKIEVWDNE